jgi:hypothetical protein
MTDSSRFAIAVSSPVNVSLLFDELDPHAFGGELADDATQVVEVAGEAIHGMPDHRVPLADEAQHGRQLGPVHVFARGLVSERAVDGKTVELPARSYPLRRHPCVASKSALEAPSPCVTASMTCRYVPCHHSRCHRCRDVTPRGGDARVPPRTPHFRRSEPIYESRERLWGSPTRRHKVPAWSRTAARAARLDACECDRPISLRRGHGRTVQQRLPRARCRRHDPHRPTRDAALPSSRTRPRPSRGARAVSVARR